MKRKNKTITLREARIEAGLTILELAKRAGMTWGTVQAIETGRTPGALMAKVSLAGALNVEFKKLWPETYSNFSPSMRRNFFLTAIAQKEKK